MFCKLFRGYLKINFERYLKSKALNSKSKVLIIIRPRDEILKFAFLTTTVYINTNKTKKCFTGFILRRFEPVSRFLTVMKSNGDIILVFRKLRFVFYSN